jgi:hypothetical protein
MARWSPTHFRPRWSSAVEQLFGFMSLGDMSRSAANFAKGSLMLAVSLLRHGPGYGRPGSAGSSKVEIG